MKSYSELIRIPTFEERYEYLRIGGRVGEETFGCNRFINQQLYTKDIRWKQLRNKIIIRDGGCDLAMPDYAIGGKIIIHHINPITVEDFMNNDEIIFDPDYVTDGQTKIHHINPIFDPENLICVSFNTHQAIHYGDRRLLPQVPIVRTKYDTCLWRN